MYYRCSKLHESVWAPDTPFQTFSSSRSNSARFSDPENALDVKFGGFCSESAHAASSRWGLEQRWQLATRASETLCSYRMLYSHPEGPQIGEVTAKILPKMKRTNPINSRRRMIFSHGGAESDRDHNKVRRAMTGPQRPATIWTNQPRLRLLNPPCY